MTQKNESIYKVLRKAKLLSSSIPKSKILLMDEDNNLLLGIKRSLIKQDFIVEIAIDSEEALSKIEDFQPNLIILDLKMHYLEGNTFLKMIKQLYHDIEVIILTGSTNFDSYTECLDNGAFCWLTKPLNINRLMVKVNSALTNISIKKQSDLKASKGGGLNWNGQN